jgi:hypothetical protein
MRKDGGCQFRYETMWERHDDLKDKVVAGLSSSSNEPNILNVQYRLAVITSDLDT